MEEYVEDSILKFLRLNIEASYYYVSNYFLSYIKTKLSLHIAFMLKIETIIKAFCLLICCVITIFKPEKGGL
jgi:type IV secretory pathway TraG/TraD family ATPase VirD4